LFHERLFSINFVVHLRLKFEQLELEDASSKQHAALWRNARVSAGSFQVAGSFLLFFFPPCASGNLCK
jgi:hypothetical protein